MMVPRKKKLNNYVYVQYIFQSNVRVVFKKKNLFKKKMFINNNCIHVTPRWPGKNLQISKLNICMYTLQMLKQNTFNLKTVIKIKLVKNIKINFVLKR